MWSTGRGTVETKRVEGMECWGTAETEGVEGVKYWISSLFEFGFYSPMILEMF